MVVRVVDHNYRSRPDVLTARIVTLKPQLDILEHPPSPRVVLEEDAEAADSLPEKNGSLPFQPKPIKNT